MEGNSRYSNVEVVKPLLKGCLTGQLLGLYRYYGWSIFYDRARSGDPTLKKKLPVHYLKDIPYKSLRKKHLFCEGFCTMASLGTFEILTKRLINVNNKGRPLSLYQEACCGLISGSTAVFFWQPFGLACSRVGIQNLTYTNWFATVAHILQNEGLSTFWRGSGFHMGRHAAAYAGMLASYDRSRNYFIQTQALSKWRAQLCGSIVSGFFAAACSHPIQYVGDIINGVQMRKLNYTSIPRCVCKLVTPYSGSNFYSDFFKRFRYATGFCVVQYAIYERVCGPTRTLYTAPAAATGLGKLLYISFIIFETLNVHYFGREEKKKKKKNFKIWCKKIIYCTSSSYWPGKTFIYQFHHI